MCGYRSDVELCRARAHSVCTTTLSRDVAVYKTPYQTVTRTCRPMCLSWSLDGFGGHCLRRRACGACCLRFRVSVCLSVGVYVLACACDGASRKVCCVRGQKTTRNEREKNEIREKKKKDEKEKKWCVRARRSVAEKIRY